MVLKLQFRTLSSMKCFYSRSIILLACVLTFLYLMELTLGVRTVCCVFELSKNARLSSSFDDDISWTIVVSALLFCVATCTVVNSISAFWDSKHITGIHSAVYYFCHILIGGIPWRYVGLWKCDDIAAEKEQAMLLASLKFLFTQVYTIPLLILHIYLSNDIYELMYHLLLIVSVAITLAVTSSIFHQYKECGNYPYETMALVPLVFKSNSSPENQEPSTKKAPETTTVNAEEHHDPSWKQLTWRTAIAIQTFCFSLGRIFALGVLLKLTGVYAITIVFLQFLLSVLYLKFQGSHLVPESLPTSKQLMRLSFLSYILIFEWQLHRETPSGYNLRTGAKYGMLYYTVATTESLFYLVVWAITADKPIVRAYEEESFLREKYVIVVSVLGCLCLIISYFMQLIPLLFRSCKTGANNSTIKVRSTTWNRLKCAFGVQKAKEPKTTSERVIPRIDITSFSDHYDIDSNPNADQGLKSEHPETDYGSYRDLKETIDYEIGIKSGKRNQLSKKQNNDLKNGHHRTKYEGKACAPVSPNTLREKLKMKCLIGSKSIDQVQCSSKDTLEVVDSKCPTAQSNWLATLRSPKRPSDNLGNHDHKENGVKKMKADIQHSDNVRRKSEPNDNNQRDIANKVSNIKRTVSQQLHKLSNRILSSKKNDSPMSDVQCKDIKIATIMNEYKDELSNDTIDDILKPGISETPKELLEKDTAQIEIAPGNNEVMKPVPKSRQRGQQRNKCPGAIEHPQIDSNHDGTMANSSEMHTPSIGFKPTTAAEKRRLYREISDIKSDVDIPSCTEVSIGCEDDDEEDIIYDSTTYQHLQKQNPALEDKNLLQENHPNKEIYEVGSLDETEEQREQFV